MKAFGLIALLLSMAIAAYLMVGPGEAGHTQSQLQQAQQAKRMEDKARAAVAGVDLEALKRGITAFQASKDRLPASLEEVKEAGYVDRVPAGVVYDPATGSVSMP